MLITRNNLAFFKILKHKLKFKTLKCTKYTNITLTTYDSFKDTKIPFISMKINIEKNQQN